MVLVYFFLARKKFNIVSLQLLVTEERLARVIVFGCQNPHLLSGQSIDWWSNSAELCILEQYIVNFPDIHLHLQ